MLHLPSPSVFGFNNFARSTLIGFSLCALLSAATAQAAEDYYIYKDSKGSLVISNQKPPSDSKILKQVTFTEPAETKTPQPEARSQPQQNGETQAKR